MELAILENRNILAILENMKFWTLLRMLQEFNMCVRVLTCRTCSE